VLGRFAPGTRRASGPVPVIADVRQKYENSSVINCVSWNGGVMVVLVEPLFDMGSCGFALFSNAEEAAI
jgi:hypothetical protein